MRWALVREVADREFRTRARTTAFRAITGLLVAAAVVGPIVAAAWPGGGDDLREVTVGLVDAGASRELIAQSGAGALDVTFRDYGGASTADVDLALVDGDIDVAVEAGPILVWDEQADLEIAGVVYAALQQQEVLVRGRALGLGEGDIAELLTPLQVEERFADQFTESDDVAIGIAFLGLLVAFNLPLAFGQLTTLSVVEEKSTRVVEVLLGHIRPRTLLFGKVLGLGALAVVQLVVFIGGLTAALVVTNAVDIPASAWRFVPVVVLALLGGLAIYNTLFALLGSLVSRQEDVSQVLLPTFLPLMGGFFVAQAAVFGNAETPLAKVLTLFPLTAPMLLPVRVARDAIAPWEVAASLGLLAVGIGLLIWLAGRVYEFTLLHTGSRVSWGELVRLSRGGTMD